MFGTFHDGSDEETQNTMERLKQKNYIKT
jgi:hypothetical protein